MKTDFLIALTQLAAEKNLPKEVVLEAVEAALASAFKKELPGAGQNISVKVNPNSGEIQVYALKSVVAEVTDPRNEMTVDEARLYDPKAILGSEVAFETPPKNAGRIAAQTAKQVVMQRLREAEREVVFSEYVGKEGDIVSGIIERIEPKQIIIDLGKAEAVLPIAEQVRNEHYRMGQRLKVYLVEVFRSNRGPQVVVSRTHRNLVRRLFELEVPEIYNGTVEIRAIAREPGHRSKVAVAARQEGVDPVGSCVGLRGIRIQNIINELGGEKIDVIQWDPETPAFVSNALSPAPVISVTTNEEDKTATVVVPDRQLSLAIGREGQNARLAAKLTGWRIDIKSASVAEAERSALAAETAARQMEAPAPVAEEVIPEVTPPESVLVLAGEQPEVAPETERETLVAAATTAEEVALALEPEAAEPVVEALVETAPALEEVPVAPVPEPFLAEPARIRFAEEISEAPRGKSKRAKGRKDGAVESDETSTAKPKRAKRSRPMYDIEEEDDSEAYNDLVRLQRR